MSEIEAILVRYGTTPDPDGWIIWPRDVAVSIAEQAKKTGKIISYRMEGDEKTGKIIATIESKDGHKMVGTSNQIDTMIWRRQHRDATAPTRDTQFAGFAKALFDEIEQAWESDTLDVERDGIDITEQKLVRIIAQRAYDLAHHVLRCNGIDIGFWDRRASDLYENEIMADLVGIPDMATLPEVSK